MKTNWPIIGYDFSYYNEAEGNTFWRKAWHLKDISTLWLDMIWKIFDMLKIRAIFQKQVILHWKYAYYFFRFYIRDLILEKSGLIKEIVENNPRIKEKFLGKHWTYNEDLNYCYTENIFNHLFVFLADIWEKYSFYEEDFKKQNNYYKRCKICWNNFNVFNLPYWIYYWSNWFKECCFNCELNRPLKKEIFQTLPDFIHSIWFVPNANFSYRDIRSTLKISPDNYLVSIERYIKTWWIEHVKKKFGNRFSALVQTWSLENGIRKWGKWFKCVATDWCICNSLDEMYIDNWLSNHKIPHTKEPFYPYDEELNPRELLRADWKIWDHLIEYFWLVWEEKYDKKIQIKLSLSKKYNIKLIPLYPKDLKNIQDKLNFLL